MKKRTVLGLLSAGLLLAFRPGPPPTEALKTEALQDLRYLSLAGMLACLVRLVFFDLSRSGTVTRAVVFIFMGLLLLAGWVSLALAARQL